MKKTFVKVRSVKDIVVFVSLLAVGIILIACPLGVGADIAGFFFILVGVLFSVLLKSDYKDGETGVKFHKREYYFPLELHSALAAAVGSDPKQVNLAEEGKGKTVRLDVYFNKGANKAYLQLFKYVPHIYEPATKVYEYEIAKVSNLVK